MDHAIPDAARPPLRLTVGGIRRERAFLIGVLLGLGMASVAWLANVEPLTVDTTSIGLRPLDGIIGERHALSPRGDDVYEYRLEIPPGTGFAFTFWVHNDAPLPTTLTEVERGEGKLVVIGARIRDAGRDDAPFAPLPYTIAPHGYAELTVRMRLRSCIYEDSTISFGSVPVAFRMLGVIPRRTEILMPMTITLVGTPSTAC